MTDLGLTGGGGRGWVPPACLCILPRLPIQTSGDTYPNFLLCQQKLYSKVLNIYSEVLNIYSKVLNRVCIGTKGSISPHLRKFAYVSAEVWTGKCGGGGCGTIGRRVREKVPGCAILSWFVIKGDEKTRHYGIISGLERTLQVTSGDKPAHPHPPSCGRGAGTQVNR